MREVLAQAQPGANWQSWTATQGPPSPSPSLDAGSPGVEWGWGCTLVSVQGSARPFITCFPTTGTSAALDPTPPPLFSRLRDRELVAFG